MDIDNPEVRALLEPKLRVALAALPRESAGVMRLEMATALGHLLVLDQNWADADTALHDGRVSFELLYAKNWPHELSLANLVAPSGLLFDDSALAALMLNDPKRAFEYFNEGRGRLLRVHMNMRSEKISDDKERLIALDYILANPSFLPVSTPPSPKLDRDLLKSIQNLRSLIDDKDATHVVGDEEISDFIPSSGAIIAPIISNDHSKAIIVRNNNGIAEFYTVDLSALNWERASNLVENWQRSYGKFLGSNRDPLMSLPAKKKIREDWLDEIDSASSSLGSVLVAPVVDALRKIGVPAGARLFWMLPGGLELLPLASALDPTTGERLNNIYESVVTTNLEQIRFTKHQASRVRQRSLFALANPTGDLKFAGIEGKWVASHFAPDARAVISDGNPILAVTAPMGKAYWHFATHGFYQPDDIWKSAIVINSSTAISVRSLFASETGDSPRLVVLSACETGLSSSFFGDTEFAGLAGAFIAHGAAGVISSLWPVDDRATALMMAKFYDLHIEHGQDPATALRNAGNWLRSATANDITSYIAQALADNRIGEADAASMRLSVQEGGTEKGKSNEGVHVTDGTEAKAQPPSPGEQRLFERPYYWASFYYVGY
jgi:CHAT domain-containing protein